MARLLWDRPCGAYLYGRHSFYHVKLVYYFDFSWEILLFPGALRVGFIIVLTWCVEPLVFGIEFARFLENPTTSMGMVCRLLESAVDLTYFVQDCV